MQTNICKLFVPFARRFSTSNSNNYKVTLVGASGKIGQPLLLLLKMCPKITNIALIDKANTLGVAADVSHVDSVAQVKGFKGPEMWPEGFKDSHIVIITAGVPRGPGMTRDDLFGVNASVIQQFSEMIAKCCPKTFTTIITNPVNSLVPVAAQVLKKAGAYDPKRLFGVTTLDLVRARTFVGEFLKVPPTSVSVPVVGGHSGESIIPLLSLSKPPFSDCPEDITTMIKKIQDAGNEVVKAKAGTGSASLAMAYSGFIFVENLLKALDGEKGVADYCYVDSCVTDATFLATRVIIGKNGIEENCGLPEMSDFEKCLLQKAIPMVQRNIKTGVDFVK